MRKSAVPALCVVVALLLGPSAAAQGKDRVSVEFSYAGRGAIDGPVEGSCAAFGGVLGTEAPLEIMASGVRLTRALIWVNQTAVRPDGPNPIIVGTPFDYARSQKDQALPDGNYTVRGLADPMVVVWPHSHPESGPPTMEAVFHADTGADWTGIADGFAAVPHLVGGPSVGSSQSLVDGLLTHNGRFPDGARGWSLREPSLLLQGAGVFHMREVQLTGPDLDLVLPPFVVEETNTTAPLGAARATSFRHEEVFLTVDSFRLADTQNSVVLACEALTADVTGRLEVRRATGAAETETEHVPFAQQVLLLEGRFALNEEPRLAGPEPMVGAVAAGDIYVVGVDFQDLVTLSIAEIAERVALGAVLLALAGAAVKKATPSLVAFVIRRRDGDPLDHPLRRLIVDRLTAQGALSEGGLSEDLGRSISTVRHHVRVLAHAGLLRRIVLRGEAILVGPGLDYGEAARHVVNRDGRLAFIHERLANGLPQREVTRALRDAFGLEPRAARKHIRRYLDLRIETQAGANA